MALWCPSLRLPCEQECYQGTKISFASILPFVISVIIYRHCSVLPLNSLLSVSVRMTRIITGLNFYLIEGKLCLVSHR